MLPMTMADRVCRQSSSQVSMLPDSDKEHTAQQSPQHNHSRLAAIVIHSYESAYGPSLPATGLACRCLPAWPTPIIRLTPPHTFTPP